METTVIITRDTPEDENWLCPENIEIALRAYCPNTNFKVVYGVAKIECKTNDSILPIVQLPNPCPIKVIIDGQYIRLYIGDRDWQWDKDGELIGEGTKTCETMGN